MRRLVGLIFRIHLGQQKKKKARVSNKGKEKRWGDSLEQQQFRGKSWIISNYQHLGIRGVTERHEIRAPWDSHPQDIRSPYKVPNREGTVGLEAYWKRIGKPRGITV